MKPGMNQYKKRTVMATILSAALLSQMAVPGFSDAPSATIDTAMESAVRIQISLQWPSQTADFSGSGWTRACVRSANGFDVIVATAGHVLDIPALEQEARPGARPLSATVKVVVRYRDGRQFTAGREDLRVDRVHDYGEVHVTSPVTRKVLPAGVTAEVSVGSHIFTIASPGALAYGYFEGTIITLDASLINDAPEGAWLCTMPVAPGASGGPVLNEAHEVVATVIGYVSWPWGGSASVIVRLPLMSSGLQTTTKDVIPMEILGSLIPFIKLGVAGGSGAILTYGLLGLLKRGGLTAGKLAMISGIVHQVVLAVEQVHGSLLGADKKALAVKMVTEILSQLGITPPASLVEAVIESSVMLMNSMAPTSPAVMAPAAVQP